MKIGYNTQIIPLFLPCSMEGYKDRIAYEQVDEIYIKTIYINEIEPVIFHVIDVVIIEKELSEKIKSYISQHFSIDEEHIFISAIHTHSAPRVSHKLDLDLEPDNHFIQGLMKEIYISTKKAIQGAVEGKVYIGKTEINGFFTNRNNPKFPFNNIAQMLRFEDYQHHNIIDIVNLACHPTILNQSNLRVSSDFVGAMREYYYQLTGHQLVFFNADCGDVSTRYVRQGTGFDEVNRVGKGIAELLSKVQYHEISLERPSIKTFSFDVDYVPAKDAYINKLYNQLKNAYKLFDKTDQRIFMKEHFLSLLDQKINHGRIQRILKSHIIEFKDVRIITLPGEIVYQLGHKLRCVDSKPTLLFTYTDDYFGYAVNQEAYGLYFETYMSGFQFGEADKMIDGIIQLIKGGNNGKI